MGKSKGCHEGVQMGTARYGRNKNSIFTNILGTFLFDANSLQEPFCMSHTSHMTNAPVFVAVCGLDGSPRYIAVMHT